MKPLIKWGLWQRRWSIMWWSIGLIAFIVLELSVYSSVKSQAAQLNTALEHMPSTMKSLFGATTDLFSPVGYLSSRLFYLLMPMMLSILAIGLGSSLIAREESDGTLELLLSRPISRGKLVMAKILYGLAAITVVAVIATFSILGMVKLVGLAVPLPRVAFAVLMAVLLSLLFGALALATASLGRLGRGASIGIATLIGLGSYIISSLETNVHWLSWPAKLLPYHYYNPTQILNGSYTWNVAIIFILISLTFSVIAWLVFRRRDLVNN
jgi:ABC-2 type transport system permease protein